MISSSALSEPDTLMACNIANKSWGVAPIEFRAFTTSLNKAELGNETTKPGLDSILT
jgi:hypothetical protein